MKILRLFFQYIYFHVPCIPRGNLSLETEFMKSLESLFHAVFPAWPEVHFLKDVERKSVLFFNSKATLYQTKPSVLLVRSSSQPKFANLL